MLGWPSMAKGAGLLNLCGESCTRVQIPIPAFNNINKLEMSNMAVIGILYRKNRFSLKSPEHLILRRSGIVKYYKSMDSVVTGFYDGSVEPSEQMYCEFAEELNIKSHELIPVSKLEPIERKIVVDDKEIKWVDHCFIYLARSNPQIKLNPEHTGYKWSRPLNNLKFPPDVDYAFNEFRSRGYDL